jgi:osmoprotectant transport system ATP-binding protein
MIRLENLTKVYDDGTVAVDDVSLEVPRGETATLVGPSGCGKTTTMTMVNRLTEITDGDIVIDGESVQEYDPIELRRNIGYVIQEIGLFDHMTVTENISIVPDLRGWDDDRKEERVEELLDLIRLPASVKDRYPESLSGGQRQRVGVARALAAKPDIMLMDEPFGALDPITREELQDEFLEIQAGLDVTILFVTHDINEALKMGDKVAVLRDGELVQYDASADLLRNPKNEFVESFIGEDRLLKQLAVVTVREVMEPASGNLDASGPTVHPDDSLKRALQQLLQFGSPLPVVEAGSVVGQVSEADIHEQTRGESQEVVNTDYA